MVRLARAPVLGRARKILGRDYASRIPPLFFHPRVRVPQDFPHRSVRGGRRAWEEQAIVLVHPSRTTPRVLLYQSQRLCAMLQCHHATKLPAVSRRYTKVRRGQEMTREALPIEL